MSRIDAKTSAKGQTTIPIAVRKVIGLVPGGSVQFVITPDNEVKLIAKTTSLSHLRGRFGKQPRPVHIDKAIADSVWEKTKPSSGRRRRP
jgi:bifunctional DNA-binding transcriptional regulator/antitoxin component of YhaV-PrlF toxin-antitoxin module